MTLVVVNSHKAVVNLAVHFEAYALVPEAELNVVQVVNNKMYGVVFDVWTKEKVKALLVVEREVI
jgi:hypothetical protein